MLALLEQQRQAVLHQGADDILHSIHAINEQGNVIRKARQIRESALGRLAKFLAEPESATFAELIPRMPDPFRPLVTALVQENNALLRNVRQRAEQNHCLLQKSLDFMRSFITNLSSEETTFLPLEVDKQRKLASDSDNVYQAIA
jgi:hypothetical protein